MSSTFIRLILVMVPLLLTACRDIRAASTDTGMDTGKSETDAALTPDYLLLIDKGDVSEDFVVVDQPPPDPREGQCAARVPEGELQPGWSNCSLRIDPVAVPLGSTPSCGPGRPVLRFALGLAMDSCVHDGWLYAGRGLTRRVRLSDQRVEMLTPALPPRYLSGVWGCSSQGLVFAAGEIPVRSVALVHFTDFSEPGHVQWHETTLPRATSDAVRGAIDNMRASDVFSFFTYSNQGPTYLYVASPTGENPRRIDSEIRPFAGEFAISGRYLVFSSDWDIYLYDYITGRMENLTPGTGWQRFSDIEGTKVVYIEYRSPDPGDFDHGNVWLLDLNTRVRTQITSQPAQPDAARFLTTIRGDWVVWEDTRNDPMPLGGISPTTRTIYGYNLRTRREYPLVVGEIAAGNAIVVGNQMYYSCRSPMALDTYVMDLPRD
jgi:hypothetical protein